MKGKAGSRGGKANFPSSLLFPPPPLLPAGTRSAAYSAGITPIALNSAEKTWFTLTPSSGAPEPGTNFIRK